MNSKEIIQASLNHQSTDRIAVDFGATAVTGMHAIVVEKLRAHYGLPHQPVKIEDTFQMLGEVDDALRERIGGDVVGVVGERDFFGAKRDRWSEFMTPWGQCVLLPQDAVVAKKKNDLYLFPEGDSTVSPSGWMPDGCYFWNAIERQQPIDDDALNVEDNLEEYRLLSDEQLAHWTKEIGEAAQKGTAVVANVGGTALGDAAYIPGAQLKCPKGIRSVAEWYMSTAMRTDYIAEVFDQQSDRALLNLAKLHAVVGNQIDVINICGTDFGTQQNLFCSIELFNELYKPYYQKINNWIHRHTNWKTFKHSCGAIEPLISSFIESGFDILNPVQINARGMNSSLLKEKYGSDIVFWGGGVDTQVVLAFGTPDEVRRQVYEQCDIFGRDGGFVFNTVHNIQANVPIQNVIAMIDTLKEINGK